MESHNLALQTPRRTAKGIRCILGVATLGASGSILENLAGLAEAFQQNKEGAGIIAFMFVCLLGWDLVKDQIASRRNSRARPLKGR